MWPKPSGGPAHAIRSPRTGYRRLLYRAECLLRQRFALGEGSSAIARDLWGSVRSVRRWRQAWAEGGPRSLRSQGPASLPRLSEKQFAQLEAELAKGPAAHGWEDQRGTLSRVKTVIGRRFHLTYTIQGVRKLLVRNGWSCQVPARRAVEGDDDAVARLSRRVGAGFHCLGRVLSSSGRWTLLVSRGWAGARAVRVRW
ncbi:winged helix-turn-helix domain-containing protein [Streptomyces halstedii]